MTEAREHYPEGSATLSSREHGGRKGNKQRILVCFTVTAPRKARDGRYDVVTQGMDKRIMGHAVKLHSSRNKIRQALLRAR